MSGQSFAPVTRRLAAILARPVSHGDKSRAARALLDWTGCAVAGAASAAGRAVRAALAKEAEGPCTVIGGTGRAPLTAALANGAVGNVLEMDDVDKRAILHPGPSVIPAALALAQAKDASTDEFLAGLVRGYEAVIRLGRAVGPGHYAFSHYTGTCGPVGAAAACASLLGLDTERTAHALALAATQASGFWQTRHEPASMAKQLHTARAAHAGLFAARLAAEGFQGPLTVFEGGQGFFAATCPGAEAEDMVAQPDSGWTIHEVSVKPWPACRHAHPAIDAALALRAQGVRPQDIDRLELSTYADAVKFCDRVSPQSVIEAKFSLQHSVAVALIEGPPGLCHFEAGAFEREDVRALAAKVRVRVAEPWDGAYPAHYGAGLRAVLGGGREIAHRQRDALGDPENPLPQERLTQKAGALCAAGGMDAAAAARLIAAALSLGEGGALDTYAAALPREAAP